MDGWITIGTKLNTDKLDKDVANLENKLKKEEEKTEIKLKVKLQAQRELEQHRQKIYEVEQEYEKLAQKVENVQGIMEKQGKGIALTPQDFTDMQNYNELNSQYTKMGSQLDKMYAKQDQLNLKVQKTDASYRDVADRVSEYKQKIESINIQKHQEDVARLKDGFGNVGSSIQNAIHQVSRLALGIFGVRSAFMAVKRASSELASYNPQYGANLEYIRYALTQMIAPVLEYIVNLAKTLLAYINYIANAWFGVNLFANASAKSFNKVKQQIGGAGKKAKELQKTLAGFDEMNILNSSSTGGGGGVGSVGPNFDLSDLDAVEIPDWIKWIANNKDLVIGAIIGIASAFLIFKTLKVTGILGTVGDALQGLFSRIGGLKSAIATLGFAAFITGIVIAVKGIIDFINNPSWESFRGILIGLATAATGLAVALLAVNSASKLGWIALAIGAVSGLAVVVGDLVSGFDDEARKAEALKKAEDDLREARNKLTSATKNYMDAVDKAEDAEKKLKEAQDTTGISIDELLKKMQNEGLTYKDLDENQRKVYKAYVNNKDAQDNLKTSTDNLSGATQEQSDKLNQLVASYQMTSSNAEDYKNKIVDAYNNGKISAEDASQAIGVAMSNMDQETRQKFTESIPSAIKKGLNPNQYRALGNSFNSWWSNVLNQAEEKSKGVFGGISSKLYSTLSAIKNMNVSKGFSVGGYVAKLATGGLVNMPNRGVPVTNAIAGEAGAEGIIPLTDQQAMAQLGAEIGRNVLVNLTNITSMNGRVISRELKTIQSEQDFAYNT